MNKNACMQGWVGLGWAGQGQLGWSWSGQGQLELDGVELGCFVWSCAGGKYLK